MNEVAEKTKAEEAPITERRVPIYCDCCPDSERKIVAMAVVRVEEAVGPKLVIRKKHGSKWHHYSEEIDTLNKLCQKRLFIAKDTTSGGHHA